MSDDFDLLAALRDFQERAHVRKHSSFAEFREDVTKGPRGGNLAHINPGLGMMGPPGNTASRAPTGPRRRPSGNAGVGFGGDHRPPAQRQPYDKPDFSTEPWFGTQQFGVPAGAPPSLPSKYGSERPAQPPPWIDDVDMASIWYSPFEPIWPFGPPYYTRPREWNYPVGYNLNYIPVRLELMGMLRGMRQSWGVLATIIETRKDQLLRLPWTIQRRDKPRAVSSAVVEMRKFFKRPDGKLTFNQWSHKLLDDLFVIDAPTVYKDRRLDGKLRNAEILDGGTIFPLIDDAGRRPDTTLDLSPDGVTYQHRQPAFQQIIYGLPMINLSEDEIIYGMMRPRPELPMFGYSPVEQILIEATEAIRKTFYQLEFWRAGSMPELIVTVPDNWTPRQIAMFQGHFDALLTGNLSLKSKVRFLPGNMKPFEIKNASGEQLWSQRDETLIRLACYAFSVSPVPFVKMTNRGTASTQQQQAQEEGLYPLMSWWKDDIMDRIIQEGFGYDDVEFVFLPRPEVDLLKQSQIHKEKISTGEMTIDEARAENGEEPYGPGIGDVPLLILGSGAVPLSQVVKGQAQPQDAAGEPRGTASPMRGPARPREASTMPEPSPVHKADGNDISRAAERAERDPSYGRKKNGNYRKGHIWLHGLNITIENAKGSKRGEKDKFGRGWKVKMPAAYGYIRGTIGADGEQVDVYIGKYPESDVAYVIDQDKFGDDGDDKGFDEHKVMLGYRSAKRAIKDYLKSHFDGLGHERLSAITVVNIRDLKRWFAEGDPKKSISEQGIGVVIGRRGKNNGISKADTISQSTGLNWYDQTTAVPKKKRRKKSKKSRQGPRWLELVA